MLLYATPKKAADWCAALHERYHAQIVLTGLELSPEEITVACCAGGNTAYIRHARLGDFIPVQAIFSPPCCSAPCLGAAT